jgi:hypothetical protein
MKDEYYRPLPECLTISANNKLTAETGRRQLGLYATMNISETEILGISHIFDDRFPDGLIRTPLGGFFNHSEDPNCKLIKFEGFYHLCTIKEIKGNEEITVKYTTYDPTK